MSTKFDIYQHVTDRIIDQLESAGKWTRPWCNPKGPTGTAFAMPTNVTGRTYRGINVPLLWAYADQFEYPTHIWGTYKQWAERGGQVRKGERGCTVTFWKFLKVEDDEGEKEIPMCRGFTVFNLAQVDGIELEQLEVRNPLADAESVRIERAERFIQATKADIRHGGDQAFYRAGMDDFIQLPCIEQFKPVNGASASETYYGTALHELTHWTGADHRCNREFGKRFGDLAYAAEELVAELGAAMLCAQLGISPTVRADHASYIRGWLKALKADKKAIFTAASKAQAACDYLIGKQPDGWDQDIADHEGETVTDTPDDDGPDDDGPKGTKPQPVETPTDETGGSEWLEWLGESGGTKGESVDSPTPDPEPVVCEPEPVPVVSDTWKGYPSPGPDGSIYIPQSFKGPGKLPARKPLYSARQKEWRKAGIGKGWYWREVNSFWQYEPQQTSDLARKLTAYWNQQGHKPSAASIAGAEQHFEWIKGTRD